MRRDQTPAELRFWQIAYTFRRAGFHFRRQAQIGPYYADFVCHAAAVIIEIDGDSHEGAQAQAYDARRTTYLESRGYSVIRFSNNEVLSSPEGVFTVLSMVLADRTPTPNPSPQGGGEVD